MVHSVCEQIKTFLSNLECGELERKINNIKGSPSTLNNALEIIQYIDLTSLTVYDDFYALKKLCSKGVRPLDSSETHVAALCCFSRFAAEMMEYIYKQDFADKIKLAVVCGGFPHAQVSLFAKEAEIRDAVANKVNEIDLVIPRALVFAQMWDELFHELKVLKRACGPSLLKVIISSGELKDQDLIQKAAAVSILAGCDFVKLCTGFGNDLATLEAGVAVASVIRKYYHATGKMIGLKTSGGVRTVEQAIQWINLVKHELGQDWLDHGLFRIGASSLLDDIIKNCN